MSKSESGEKNPEKKKVAIVGSAWHWDRVLPLINNPEFEIWSLNDMAVRLPRADRWFQMHPPEKIHPGTLKYYEFLRDPAAIPVYMIEKYSEFPTSIKYPLEEFLAWMISKVGTERRYFTNSVAYMLALALYEGFKEVHVYGVDMAVGSEYVEQRPSVEYWLGAVEWSGIKLYITPESDLLKKAWLYGYEEEKADFWRNKIKSLQANAKKEAQKHLTNRDAEDKIAQRLSGTYEMLSELLKEFD